MMNINYGAKEWFSIITIPLVYVSIYLVHLMTDNSLTLEVVDAVLRILIFIILVILFKNLLKEHWHEFRNKSFYKWIFIILGAILLQVIISLASTYLPSVDTVPAEPAAGREYDFLNISWGLYIVLVFTSLSPTVTSLIEDIVFKHTLLEKLLSNSVIWNIVLVIVNSIVFGAIHYANFGNSFINTIPYMFAGLFLNLIYLRTRNLWYVLLIHFFNNFILSTLAILSIGILRIFIH
jgi:membrane protease YdiL (CAAX protease family)